jgi:hypothetical protein
LGCSSNVQCNQQLLETFHQEYLYKSSQISLLHSVPLASVAIFIPAACSKVPSAITQKS